jgi:dipeptidyl-peptidase 4
MKRLNSLVVIFLFSFSLWLPVTAAQTSTTDSIAKTGKKKIDPTNLTIEDFYKLKPFTGRKARKIRFSKSNRFLAFLWNGYDEMPNDLARLGRKAWGNDLYVYDLKTQTLTRVTSLEKMKRFDTPEDYEEFIKQRDRHNSEGKRVQELFLAQRDFLEGKDVDLSALEMKEIEALKKELAEKEKKEASKKADKKADKSDKNIDKKNDKISDENKDKKKEKKKELELWELRDKLKEKREKDKVDLYDLYPGVGNYKWTTSTSTDELIFQYRGDLYRYFVNSRKISRLTMTDEKEGIKSYTADGRGYYFTKGSDVFKVLFNSSYIHQINHKLSKENKYKIYSTDISPNDRWMLIFAGKKDDKPGYKKVNIASYQKRFVEVTKTYRQMADDKRNEPQMRLILREIRKSNYGKEPEHLLEFPGGDVWFEYSDIEWARDSSKYAFMTWEREKGDLKIWLGEANPGKKPEVIFQVKEKIGFKSFYDNNLKFTPDGKNLLAILNNEAGFRQPVIFDLKTLKKKELIKGNFESYPIIGFSNGGKYFYVLSDKEDPATHSVYKVGLKTGKMTRIGKSGVMHRDSDITANGKWLASSYGNWADLPELHIINTTTKKAKSLTDSHSKEWDKYDLIKPELFKYKNRHGDMISGMVFKPFGWKQGDKRPGIVHMYGGPLLTDHTVEVDKFSTLSYMFQMYMAARHGYVTVVIDTRGMSGYGRKFSEANFENPGNSQVEDLEDLVAHMKNGFGVDTDRLGLHGWSFGGYQTIKTMLSSPETFACGIAVASVTEWENYNSWYTGSTIGKSVRGKPTLRKYSLLPLAKNLKHPILLIHGMLDPNVLYQDTLKMYQALLEAGKETLVDLFLDPTGDHSLNGIAKNKSIYKKFESYFLNHLGNVGGNK